MASVDIFRGDTWIRTWTIKVDGTPLDLTGASARLQVRVKPGDDTVLLDLSTATEGLTIMEPPLGGIIHLRTQTEALEAGKYVFDLQVTFADGTIKTYEQSTLVVKPDVTR